MALASWYFGDFLPYLPTPEGFTVAVEDDDSTMAVLNGLSVGAVAARRRAGSVPYVAHLFGRPVAYGWVARGRADIGELGLSFEVPADQRYLWDFHTLPFCRGRGIYPRLLQSIVLREDASRFWIIHAPENLPSGVGIEHAGFTEVGELSFRATGGAGLRPTGPIDRAFDASDLLGVPLVAGGLPDCWTCSGPEPGGCTCSEASDTNACACKEARARRSAAATAARSGFEAELRELSLSRR